MSGIRGWRWHWSSNACSTISSSRRSAKSFRQYRHPHAALDTDTGFQLILSNAFYKVFKLSLVLPRDTQIIGNLGIARKRMRVVILREGVPILKRITSSIISVCNAVRQMMESTQLCAIEWQTPRNAFLQMPYLPLWRRLPSSRAIGSCRPLS